MKSREEAEAWADALLDQHRSTPPPHRGPATDDQMAQLDGVTRWMLSRSGQPPDAHAVDRLLRSRERHRRVNKYFELLQIFALLCVAALVWGWLQML